MMSHLYELLAPLGPEWSALLVGFAIIGFDGRFYLTELGAEYLARLP